jgi:hypothetical protein
VTHVDDFIDDHAGDPYARWMLLHFRLSAVNQIDFAPFYRHKRLFCDYEGRRYRVTGASRMGDVWLHSNHHFDPGKSLPFYELRVAVDDCSNWGAEP